MNKRCNGTSLANRGPADSALPASAAGLSAQHAYVSEYRVPAMDCPAEENMIRMVLEGIEPRVMLAFDIPNRKVSVFHGDNAAIIEERMRSLGLGSTRENTVALENEAVSRAQEAETTAAQAEAGILKWLLAINAVMFALEFVVGWLAQSTGLIADSLDMLADAAVYGVALFAVAHSAGTKLRAAHFSGCLQLLLACGVLLEVGRRFVFGSEPVSALMMGFGVVALAANVWCLLLISKRRHGGAHMKASWIFSANDVLANAGVILAGLLVAWTGSHYPDLVIGLIIGLLVLNGARRILQLQH